MENKKILLKKESSRILMATNKDIIDLNFVYEPNEKIKDSNNNEIVINEFCKPKLQIDTLNLLYENEQFFELYVDTFFNKGNTSLDEFVNMGVIKKKNYDNFNDFCDLLSKINIDKPFIIDTSSDNKSLILACYEKIKVSKSRNFFNLYRLVTIDLEKIEPFNIRKIEAIIESHYRCSSILKLIRYSYLNDSDPDKMFYKFRIPKKGEGRIEPKCRKENNSKKIKYREITAPNEDLKVLLKELVIPMNKAFKTRLNIKESNQFAYVKNRSIKDNVLLHKDNEYVIKFDFKQFFDSCNWKYIRKYIPHNSITRSYEEEYLKSIFVAKETNGLCLGNPVSGILSNMVIHPVIYYLQNILNPKGITLSVYADDLTFSSKEKNEYFNKKYLQTLIESKLEECNLSGITLNKDKTRLLKNNGRRITGIRINHLNELTSNRQDYLLFKSILNHLEYGKPVTYSKSKISGRLSFYLNIDTSGKWERLVKKYSKVLEENRIIIPNKYKEGMKINE